MVNTILKEADLFCPNSVRINFTIYHYIFELMLDAACGCQH
ncbi:ABC transporter ATP-binding protein [Lactobacillus rossiae]|uniref:ABC transporter ATP-binding protein n=1 Tax=Furfurilactobacillus milii TaxID=2888272 RepID=A0A6N9I3C9_9LACO|nr:ABC transporter ATP-binding protein [Furfurilactobacillus milii]